MTLKANVGFTHQSGVSSVVPGDLRLYWGSVGIKRLEAKKLPAMKLRQLTFSPWLEWKKLLQSKPEWITKAPGISTISFSSYFSFCFSFQDGRYPGCERKRRETSSLHWNHRHPAVLQVIITLGHHSSIISLILQWVTGWGYHKANDYIWNTYCLPTHSNSLILSDSTFKVFSLLACCLWP